MAMTFQCRAGRATLLDNSTGLYNHSSCWIRSSGVGVKFTPARRNKRAHVIHISAYYW